MTAALEAPPHPGRGRAARRRRRSPAAVTRACVGRIENDRRALACRSSPRLDRRMKLAGAPVRAATSRATPSSDRQSARFGVSLSVSRRSSRSRWRRMSSPTGAAASGPADRRRLRQCRVPGRAEHAEGLDAAHLADLDLKTTRQLGAGQRTRHLDPGGSVRARRRRSAAVRRRRRRPGTDVEAIGIRMPVDGEHLRDDDPSKAGATVSSSSTTSRPAMVSRCENSARAGGVDEAAKPGFREFHARSRSEGKRGQTNCRRKRRSPSKNRRRSLTP
jgi:hypothetical protein